MADTLLPPPPRLPSDLSVIQNPYTVKLMQTVDRIAQVERVAFIRNLIADTLNVG